MRTALLSLLCLPVIAWANPSTPATPGTALPPVITVINGGSRASSDSSVANYNYNNPQSSSAASGSAITGPVNAANSLNVETRLAQAPDVISYPTAPCRISIGASGGWFGGAVGFSGSSEDEGCTLRETSRQLWNVGQRDAAVQILCLNADAKAALEATGVACKVSRQSAEKVTP
jgi:hypothetical protein